MLGSEDTLLALNEERVWRLFVDGGANVFPNGWRCTFCDALGRKAEAGCPYCGSETTTVDLREEVVRKALAQGAHVSYVSGFSKLRHFHGLGALLRRGRNPVNAGVGHAEHEPLPAR